MNTDPHWREANQRYLMARVALAREYVSSVPGGAAVRVEEYARELPSPAAIDTLVTSFGLSSFERDLLLLCAGMELDGEQAEAPTFSLALAKLPSPNWYAITPAGPLRYWRLLELGQSDAVTRAPLKIDERVLHYLTGITYEDVRLQSFIAPSPAALEMMPRSHCEAATRVAEHLSTGTVVQLTGENHPDKLAVASLACTLLGIGLGTLRAEDLPPVLERETLSRLWEREAVLSSSALLVDCEEMENRRAVSAFVEALRGMVMVAGRESVRTSVRSSLRVEVPRPSVPEQKTIWQEALGPAQESVNGHVDAVIAHFHLGARGIAAASHQVKTAAAQGQELAPELLWEACRQQSRTRLDGLAQRMETKATWDDLVLPEAEMHTLRDIAQQVRFRTKVYEEWGFSHKSSRGLGISALFAGPPGTGKTLAAEVVANDLRLDLYRIDLSQVVSKYIGETEKNLQRVFDGAEESGAVLLFDEADAIFGKRSDIKDSHDRYANIEVSYLLQRMEAYRGLAILTTNMKSLLDTAFLRRIRFIVQFPFPEHSQRTEIWRRIFPSSTPVQNLDANKLASLNVAGGHIRNIALQAAFLAAGNGQAVTMRHLLQAARAEYTKLEKPLAEAEIRGWV